MSDRRATGNIPWQSELEAWLFTCDHLRQRQDEATAAAEVTRARDRVARAIADTIAAQPDALAPIVAWIAARFEQRFGALANRGTAVDRPTLQEALALQDDLRYLRAELAKHGAGDVWLTLELEHSWLTSLVRRLGGEPSAPALRAELDRLDEALRETRAQRALRRSSEARSVPELHRDLLELAELLSECHGLRSSGVTTRLVETRYEHRAQIEARVRALPAAERAVAFAACTRATLDHADEMLTALDDMPLQRCAFTLELIRDDLAFTRGLAPDGAGQRADCARWLKKLRTEERWYRRELKEKAVEQRMVQRFGARAVAALENTILILTLAVLALITFELLVGVPAKWEQLFFTTDALICSVFLAEYALKTVIAPDHFDYARRHFVLDFLPSIPFGFLTANLLPADYARAGRAARLLRLPALARYARALRPLVRMLRFLGFLMRGMDRLVRSQAWWLNVNIIFLEDSAEAAHGAATRLESLERRVRLFLSEGLEILAPPERAGVIERALAQVRADVARAEHLDLKCRAASDTSVAREVHFVALVDALCEAQVSDVEGKLDRHGAERMRQVLSAVDRPVIRWLPVLGKAARGCRRIADPYECVAHAARALGGRLERWLGFGRGFADLYGVMTAPQLLDRLGTALAKATQRPALRLLLIGCLFLLVQLIAQALGSRRLQGFATALNTHLGAPILIFGLICLTLLLLGKWLQSISGEATETFRRVSEAQFASLIKELKRDRRDQDFAVLQQRVLAFERAARAPRRAPPPTRSDRRSAARRASRKRSIWSA